MAQTPSLGTLPSTVSLLHNNLACSSGGWLCSVHNTVVSGGGGKLVMHQLGGSSKMGPEVAQAMSVSYIELAFGPVLVVCSTNGTQMYNEDATALLAHWPIRSAATGGDSLQYHQGACLVPGRSHIVIGTSKGSLELLHASGPHEYIGMPASMPSSPGEIDQMAVADVCYCAATDTVITAHVNGELRTWDPASDYKNTGSVPAVGQAPVRVASLNMQIMVAFGAGTICLFHASTYEVQAELTAHARWINAVGTREDAGQIVTVGEDTILNLWQVEPSSGEVSLLHSSVVADKLLTGVAMLTGGAAVTAYDSAEVYHVTM